MKVTYLGHASLSLTIDKLHILVDPFISGNDLAKHIDISSLKADYILITHAHEDHILDVERIAKQTRAKIISNFEIVNHFGEKGIDGHPMNHGGSWNFSFGKVTYTHAVHTSSFPDGSYGGQPGGFILETNHNSIYIAGDTALTMDMKLIPLYTKLDLAILPIGDNFTMGIKSAIMAANFVECDRILGVHYDTFGYIEIDKKEAIESFAESKKKLELLGIGKSLTL